MGKKKGLLGLKSQGVGLSAGLLGKGLIIVTRKNHLDDALYVILLERLQDFHETVIRLSVVQSLFLAGCRQINNGNMELIMDLMSGFDPVHGAFEPDIHQDQVRIQVSGFSDGFFSGGSQAAHLIAEPAQDILDIPGDDRFILDD